MDQNGISAACAVVKSPGGAPGGGGAPVDLPQIMFFLPPHFSHFSHLLADFAEIPEYHLDGFTRNQNITWMDISCRFVEGCGE